MLNKSKKLSRVLAKFVCFPENCGWLSLINHIALIRNHWVRNYKKTNNRTHNNHQCFRSNNEYLCLVRI